MIINEYGPFIQSIIEHPEDWNRRIVFADWLEEHQSSQADYIRICHELAQLESHEPSSSKSQNLKERALAHIELDQRKWNAPVHRILSKTAVRKSSRRGGIRRWSYSRGCIEHVDLTMATFENHLDTVLGIGPIRSIKLVGPETISPPQAVELIGRCERMRRIQRLNLRSIACPRQNWESLFSESSLGNLTHLVLGQWSLTGQPFGHRNMRSATFQEGSFSSWSRELVQPVFAAAGPTLKFVELQICLGPGNGAIPVEFDRHADTGEIQVRVADHVVPYTRNLRL
jgi:uncharacterized protein (TIGR02996 family)